jgi:hypothetical protein
VSSRPFCALPSCSFLCLRRRRCGLPLEVHAGVLHGRGDQLLGSSPASSGTARGRDLAEGMPAAAARFVGRPPAAAHVAEVWQRRHALLGYGSGDGALCLGMAVTATARVAWVCQRRRRAVQGRAAAARGEGEGSGGSEQLAVCWGFFFEDGKITKESLTFSLSLLGCHCIATSA